MKIQVTLTIDVDPQKWDHEYGGGTDPAYVKADVTKYVINSVQNLTGITETDAEVWAR
jgi:hypothetical protein